MTLVARHVSNPKAHIVVTIESDIEAAVTAIRELQADTGATEFSAGSETARTGQNQPIQEKEND